MTLTRYDVERWLVDGFDSQPEGRKGQILALIDERDALAHQLGEALARADLVQSHLDDALTALKVANELRDRHEARAERAEAEVAARADKFQKGWWTKGLELRDAEMVTRDQLLKDYAAIIDELRPELDRLKAKLADRELRIRAATALVDALVDENWIEDEKSQLRDLLNLRKRAKRD